jgi:septal ring factor EnvC (AmiA/AmiB activator)
MRAPLFIISLSMLCVLLPSVAGAKTPPIPTKKSDAIESFDQQIKVQTEATKSLEEKKKSIQAELKDVQKKLVKLGTSMQKNEKALRTLNASIAAKEAEQADIQEQLKKDRGDLADLILALQRIRRLPPEALMAKPDAPLKTAQSAMLLQSTLPRLYEQAEALKENLAKNEKLTQDLILKRADAQETSAQLQKEHSSLSAMASKREALYRSTQADIKAREAQAKAIAKKARSLKDLVQNLEEQRTRNAKAQAQKRETKTAKSYIPKAGQARLPIAGIIKTQYNQPDHFGAPSQGIDIEGRGGALAVAPMGGVVRFTGPFKNFGNMVIIEHKGGYHSLVAGLEKIDTVVGQSVLSGEPLGLLHYAKGSEKPVLYYELRYNGKAVNPARKISGLS